jgi:hypothetical protein
MYLERSWIKSSKLFKNPIRDPWTENRNPSFRQWLSHINQVSWTDNHTILSEEYLLTGDYHWLSSIPILFHSVVNVTSDNRFTMLCSYRWPKWNNLGIDSQDSLLIILIIDNLIEVRWRIQRKAIMSNESWYMLQINGSGRMLFAVFQSRFTSGSRLAEMKWRLQRKANRTLTILSSFWILNALVNSHLIKSHRQNLQLCRLSWSLQKFCDQRESARARDGGLIAHLVLLPKSHGSTSAMRRGSRKIEIMRGRVKCPWVNLRLVTSAAILGIPSSLWRSDSDWSQADVPQMQCQIETKIRGIKEEQTGRIPTRESCRLQQRNQRRPLWLSDLSQRRFWNPASRK